VVAAKSLRDFAKANPLLVIKGGVLDGKPLSSDEISKLADLESREVLLAKLAGAMKAAPQQAVSLFAAPLSQAARLFAALQDKLPAEAAPVQDTVADEAPAVQDTVEAPAEASTEETASAES
jgi:large subunit ribosomal protein L10